MTKQHLHDVTHVIASPECESSTGNAPGLAGMIGCGMAGSFGQLLAARCLTGVGSALQNTGAQLFLADISTPENRAQCLGTNQVTGRPTAAASAWDIVKLKSHRRHRETCVVCTVEEDRQRGHVPHLPIVFSAICC